MAPAFHPDAARSIELLRAITVDLGEPDYVDELQAFDLGTAQMTTLFARTAADEVQSQAEELAARTSEAWSADRYGNAQWTRAARLLLERGFSPEDCVTILESKWTRWAADEAAIPNCPTGADLLAFMDRYAGKRGHRIEDLYA